MCSFRSFCDEKRGAVHDTAVGIRPTAAHIIARIPSQQRRCPRFSRPALHGTSTLSRAPARGAELSASLSCRECRCAGCLRTCSNACQINRCGCTLVVPWIFSAVAWTPSRLAHLRYGAARRVCSRLHMHADDATGRKRTRLRCQRPRLGCCSLASPGSSRVRTPIRRLQRCWSHPSGSWSRWLSCIINVGERRWHWCWRSQWGS